MSAPFRFRDLAPEEVYDYESDFLGIAADVPGEYWSRENLLMDLPEKWNLSFAVWMDNRPVAYAILSKKEADRAHLHHLMVVAEQRNLGVGSAMLTEMEQRVRRLDCARLTLKVGFLNVDAQRFYLRHGFYQQSRDGDYVNMCKDLPVYPLAARSGD